MKRLVRLFAVALLMSALVSVIYNRAIDSGGGSTPTATATALPTSDEDGGNRVSVIVAEVNLEPYERVIEKTMVKKVKFPEELLPRYAPIDIKNVVGKLPTEPIYRGEIVSLRRLIDKDEYKESLRRLIPRGHRALTIQVDTLAGVSGFISQGDFIDLAVMYDRVLPGAAGSSSTKICRVILQNIRVLIVGNKYNPLASDNPTGNIVGDLGAKPITFAVTPHDAALIHHVVQQGKSSFRILLKNPEDQDVVDTTGYSVRQLEDDTRTALLAMDSGGAPGPDGKEPEFQRVTRIVEVYRGAAKARDESFEELIPQN